MTTFLTNKPFNHGRGDAPATVVLAHGAGAPMDSPFMAYFAEGLAARGLAVVRFEFPYMASRRVDQKRRPPNPQRILLDTWQDAIDRLSPANLIIGGKSMGGRMASLWLAQAEEAGTTSSVKGLMCLGYPFHPPGKPEKLRTEHLAGLQTPALICQGTRDTFGTKEEVPTYPLAQSTEVCWLEDGDHSFKPRKASGRTETQNWECALDAMAAFTLKVSAF